MTNSMFHNCRNLFGHLQPGIINLLSRVIDDPTQQTWSDAHTIICGADGSMTLWQAVLAADPTFPRSWRCGYPWERIPDSLTLVRALRLCAPQAADRKQDLQKQRYKLVTGSA